MATTMRFLSILGFTMFLAAFAGAAVAQSDDTPEFAVYHGKNLKISFSAVIAQLNALPEIAYVDSQITNDFTEQPVHDAEKISATTTGARLEFWSDDSLDGLSLESVYSPLWSQFAADDFFVVNDPENAVAYQVQGFTGDRFIIANSFRNTDESGHLAAEQKGGPDDRITFDNAGNLAQAEHIADLLTTAADLAAALPTDPNTQAISSDSAAAPPAVPPGSTYAYPASAYFEGDIAIRVNPEPDGASVNILNISTATQKVTIIVDQCQNIPATDCGTKFTGPLGAGMTVSFPVSGSDNTVPWNFHVDVKQAGS